MKLHILKIVAVFLGVAMLFVMGGCTKNPPSSQLVGVVDSIQGTQTPAPTSKPSPNEAVQEYRAVWFSYLELEQMDFSTQEVFTQQIQKMFDNCAAININTVIVQVRPFGDALYKSSIFPTSHLITGTQGDEISYDPLEIMVSQAHERGLKIEAWVNPYRIKLTEKKPATLSQNNPATAFMADETKKDFVFSANGGLFYNPAILQVQQLIADGVKEIVDNYDVDGIQFDDYFYPEGASSTFDLPYYNMQSRSISLEDWRRENVNSLISMVYKTVKQANPNVYFGVSPQGNNDNNYNTQYSDVGLWLSTEGYVDYIMPQIYWGYNFTLKNGSDKYSYLNCLQDWLAMPRHDSVKLYIGLGTFRVGAGDGSSTESGEWQSGSNMAKMITDLRDKGADGFALYRYDNLFNNPEYAQNAQSEAEGIKQVCE